MPQHGPLRWLDGEGWIVLSGGGDYRCGETDQVDAQLLSVANLDRPMVVLTAEGTRADAEQILEHYTQLGGPGGEAFSLAELTRLQLETDHFLTLLQEAGILYLGGQHVLPLVSNLHHSPALGQIVEGFSTYQGLSLIGVGAGAAALGHWAFTSYSPHQQALGLGFVMGAVVVPHFHGTRNSPILRALPQIRASQVEKSQPGIPILGLGVPEGTALALGPQGQVETWGADTVTAVLSATGDVTDDVEG